MGSLPFLVFRVIAFASFNFTLSGAVTKSLMGVITAPTRVVLRSLMKSVSRFVTNPSNFEPILPFSVTGKPVKPHFARISSSSDSSMVGPMHMGSMMKPLLYLLTFMTSSTWSSTDMFVWMIPMPPSRATAIAMFDSVTVSMGLETMG
eukprot:CAMPEP_0172800152 /NCGR_PEP_ID=MMETSP1075-20121228/2384_1 /TAXON_ID=2916 /ORGANISM="Ceratium fusus, Strain PA161109" /LENGTH=147 /DNA_ID=CAMNT_0013637995 /DNA_START=193 /DNA_END=633 /DNA_ORIENTATION=-